MTHPTATMACLAVLMAAIVQSGDGQTVKSPSPRIGLVQTASFVLPPEVVVGGGNASSSGVLLLWGMNGRLFSVVHDTVRFLHKFDAHIISAAVDAHDDFLSVVTDDRQQHTVRVTDGKLIATVSLPGVPRTSEVLAAAHTSSGWVLATYSAKSATGGTLELRDSLRVVVLERHARSPGLSGENVRLTRVGEGLLLSSVGTPFWGVVVDPSSGRSVLTLEPPVMLDEASPSSPERPSSPLWVSLALSPLDSGYVQSLADLKSSDRALVLYSRSGDAIHYSALHTPMGVITTEPRSKSLFAVFSYAPNEVVRYQWRWLQQPKEDER